MTGTSRAAVIADPAGTLLALDFDGTLAHVVDDPAQAYAHERAVVALSRLGRSLGHIAIITGRPVRQVLELGGFLGHDDLHHLVICGQYGAERWDGETGEIAEPDRPEAITRLSGILPGWLAARGADHVRLEDKGLAVAIHTRGIEPGILEVLAEPLSALAAGLGLTVEPGRQVIELRSTAVDKGDVLRGLVKETGARQVIFAGDDLGDLPAFDAVDQMRTSGIPGLLICSASAEQDVLVARADVVLDGPDAVATWLEQLADEF